MRTNTPFQRNTSLYVDEVQDFGSFNNRSLTSSLTAVALWMTPIKHWSNWVQGISICFLYINLLPQLSLCTHHCSMIIRHRLTCWTGTKIKPIASILTVFILYLHVTWAEMRFKLSKQALLLLLKKKPLLWLLPINDISMHSCFRWKTQSKLYCSG